MPMANMHGIANYSSSSPPEPDDFSLFLHQLIMLPSSSSPSSYTPLSFHQRRPIPHRCCQSSVVPAMHLRSWPESTAPENLASFQSAMNQSPPSISIGTASNYLNEYDSESQGILQEGFVGLVEEAPAKPTPVRNGSKRSRAAEVHNLSEKRRRSRINERMRALQNLIPNSNKTDKASMLDEAIEYLKQLQLQVQLLTVKNGLSLQPMCLPGVLLPSESFHLPMGYFEGNRFLNDNMARGIPLNQQSPFNVLSTLPPDDSVKTKQTSAAELTELKASENSFGFKTSSHVDLIGFFQIPLPGSSEESFMENNPDGRLRNENFGTNSTGHSSASVQNAIELFIPEETTRGDASNKFRKR